MNQSVVEASPPRQRATFAILLNLAWPVMLSRVSQVVVGLSDAMFVAELGSAAVAATATGANNSFTVMILPMGVVFIVASYASQLIGNGDREGARRYAWYGLAIALATQVACLVSLSAIEPLLALGPYETEVRVLMAKFMRVRLLTGGAAIGIEALSSYYGGLGRTRPGMIANVAAMLLNVLLNWVFIWGHFGVPAMGVVGSALASCIATGLAFAGFFGWFLWEGRTFPKPKLSWRELRRMLQFGVPSGINWFLEFAAFIFFINVVVASLGKVSLAAMNSVILLNSFAFMPALGLASAGAILVGQAIGANAKDEVPGVVWLTLRGTAVWQAVVGLVYLALPGLMMAPFARGDDGEAVRTVGIKMLMVSVAWQLFDATATTLAEALRAAGDTLFPLLVRLAVAWLIFVPGAWFTVRRFGGHEVEATLWLVAYLALLALVLVLRFRSGAWRNVQLIDPLAAA